MQAIRTRYHGPSNVKGSRIAAKCEGGALSMPYNHSLTLQANHAEAARQLAERLGWVGVYHGGYFDRDYYWVCESGWMPSIQITTNVSEAA
jgi:hypothetical protein